MERVIVLLNAAFAMAILDLISHVHHERSNQTRILYETNSERYRGQISTLSFENLSVEEREYWHFQQFVGTAHRANPSFTAFVKFLDTK
jgi:hypothetical protein